MIHMNRMKWNRKGGKQMGKDCVVGEVLRERKVGVGYLNT